MYLNEIEYHLKKARPENYLDTFVSLMMGNFDQGKIFHIADFHPYGVMQFLLSLSEKEVYNIFLNFYASSFSRKITDEAKGFLVFCALFFVVVFTEEYPSELLIHVDANYIYKLYKSKEDFITMISELVHWYTGEQHGDSFLELWEVADDISVNIESDEDYDFSELKNKTNEIINDLTITTTKLIAVLGLYMEKLIPFAELVKEISDTAFGAFLYEYDNCFWSTMSLTSVRNDKLEEIKRNADMTVFGTNDLLHEKAYNDFRLAVREVLCTMCKM